MHSFRRTLQALLLFYFLLIVATLLLVFLISPSAEATSYPYDGLRIPLLFKEGRLRAEGTVGVVSPKHNPYVWRGCCTERMRTDHPCPTRFTCGSNCPPSGGQTTCGTHSREVRPDTTTLPTDPTVKIGTLPNGLTYYIRKNAEPKNRAELYLVNKIGSLQEDDNQQGLAHFTEHMAFNGTRDFPKNELIDYLQKAGVRFGADLNAYTSFDETVYQLPLPTDSIEVFHRGFDILLNWAGHVSFDGEEIDKERGIILEEERQRGKNAMDRMNKQIFPVLMAGSRYAERLPIGKTEILETFKHKTIKKFYRDWYRPDLQAIIAVGDFDPAEVEKLIISKFSSLQNSKRLRERRQYSIPANKEVQVRIVTDPEYAHTSVSVFYKHQKQTIRTEQDYRLALVKSMITRMLNDRITELKQKGQAAFLAAKASHGSFVGNLDSFGMSIVARDADVLEDAVREIMDEVYRMKKYGFTETEIARAKQNLLAGMEAHYKEREKTKSSYYVREYQRHFLSGEATPGIAYEYALYNRVVPAIEMGEVNKIAASLITSENCVIILQANEKDKSKLPYEAVFRSWFDQTARDITAYIDETTDEPLMATLPAAGTVVSEKRLEEVNATELKLSNGATVILKATDFKNDEILISAISPGGISLASDENFRSAQYASYLVNNSGLASFNESQLKKLLTGKNLSVQPYIYDFEEGMSGATVPKDIETTLQLMHLYFTAPRKDTAVFKTMTGDIQVSISNRYENPVAAFRDTLSLLMTSRHPRARLISLDETNALSQDHSLEYYRNRFADAGDFTFFFVGNFDVEKIKPLLCQYIGSLPATDVRETIKDTGMNPLEGKIVQTVNRGLEDKSMVALIYHGDHDYGTKQNLELAALKSILQVRLTERLREKESGVYSPGVHASFGKIPAPRYSVQVSFSCAPANVDRLIEAVSEEIANIQTDGISEGDLDKFVAEEKRQHELQLRSNPFWLNHLKSIYRSERDLNHLQTYPNLLGTLTPNDLLNAAKKFLNPENSIQLTLQPEKL